MSKNDAQEAVDMQIRRAVIFWENGGGDIEVILKAHLAGYRPPVVAGSIIADSVAPGSDGIDASPALRNIPATMDDGVFTPSTEWIRIMVGYSKTTAIDRTLPIDDARQEGYAWFDRWVAAFEDEIRQGAGFAAADETAIQVEAILKAANQWAWKKNRAKDVRLTLQEWRLLTALRAYGDTWKGLGAR